MRRQWGHPIPRAQEGPASGEVRVGCWIAARGQLQGPCQQSRPKGVPMEGHCRVGSTVSGSYFLQNDSWGNTYGIPHVEGQGKAVGCLPWMIQEPVLQAKALIFMISSHCRQDLSHTPSKTHPTTPGMSAEFSQTPFFFLSRRNILPFPLPDGPRATQHPAVHCVVGHTGGLGPSGGLQCGIHPCWCGSGDVYMSKQTCLNRDLSKYGSGSKVMAFSWMEELQTQVRRLFLAFLRGFNNFLASPLDILYINPNFITPECTRTFPTSSCWAHDTEMVVV